MGELLWGGVKGFPFRVHHGLNILALDDIHPDSSNDSSNGLLVFEGETFFISFEVTAGISYRYPDDMGVWFLGHEDGPVPGRLWKFYKQPPPWLTFYCGIPDPPYGWVARSTFLSGKNEGIVLNIWFSMTIKSDVPPSIISFTKLSDTTSTDPLEINVEIIDCNPIHPESVGVASAKLFFIINNSTTDSAEMINSGGNFWMTTIPGQKGGSNVKYYITATDINGNSTLSESNMYTILTLQTPFYSIDTSATFGWIDLGESGTTLSNWQITNAYYEPQDDGTIGPIDIGGPFKFFGRDVRYAWIGVNGALSLSDNPDEKFNLNNGLYGYTSALDFPNQALPKNFIGVYYNDFVVLPPIASGQGSGRVLYKEINDKFIIEWENSGTFNRDGSTTSFEIILDRSDNSITLLYDDIESANLNKSSLVAMQADPQRRWMLLNREGTPRVFQPRDGRVLKFIPNFTFDINESWNLISIPSTVQNMAKSEIFPDASSNAFEYRSSYVIVDSLQYGRGYWIKYPESQPIPMIGEERLLDTIRLSSGWNMIGSISNPVPINSITTIPDTLLKSRYFSYKNGYVLSDTILPGKGYWVKAASLGKIILSSSGFMEKTNKVNIVEVLQQRYNTLLIEDKAGNRQQLWFGMDQGKEFMEQTFELPPQPPYGIFDTRFITNRILELVDSGDTKEVGIQLSSAVYPITLSWKLNQKIISDLVIDNREIQLLSDGSVRITSDDAIIKLILVGSISNFPKEYILYQNHPNPFNPVTKIEYELPIESRVTLKIFNVLGQELKTLVDEIQVSGFKSVEWNASNLGSGVYFYRLEATSLSEPTKMFTQVRKMLLLR